MSRRSQFSFQDITHDALLLVEGVNDARFFNAFLTRGLRATNVQIAEVGGKSRFRNFLFDTLKNADSLKNLHRLGIVRDADANATSAFQSIRYALQNAGFPAPQQPWQSTQSSGLTVSVAILPDCNAPGDLDELCLQSISGSPASDCIDAYIDCMDSAGYSNHQPNKSRLYAYLAIGNEPGLRLGEAAEAGVWDWNSPAFTQVASFLRNLAGG